MIFSILSRRAETCVIFVESVVFISRTFSSWSFIGETCSKIACSAISVIVSGEMPEEYWSYPCCA